MRGRASYQNSFPPRILAEALSSTCVLERNGWSASFAEPTSQFAAFSANQAKSLGTDSQPIRGVSLDLAVTWIAGKNHIPDLNQLLEFSLAAD